MDVDREYQLIISSFVDGVKLLNPGWFRNRRGKIIKTPAFHYEIEDALLAVDSNGEYINKFVSFRAPRGHAKTTIISKAFNLWQGVNSACVDLVDEYIVIGSASQRQSMSWLRDILSTLLESEKIRFFFGRVSKGKYWKESEGDVEVRFASGKTIRYRCSGAGQEWRGDQYGAIRPTLVTLDDITRDDESKSELGRSSRVDWVLSTIVPMLDVEGRLVNVGTPKPYSDDWNAGVIEDLASSGEWTLKTWRAVEDMNDPNSKVLWPARYDLEWLLSRYRMFKKTGREHLWWSEFQCTVVRELGKAFPESWYTKRRWDGNVYVKRGLTYIKPEGIDDIPVNVFVGVDSAFSSARKANLTVISAWGVDCDGGLWQLEEEASRGINTPDALRSALRMADRNAAKHIMFERVAAQAALKQFCLEEQKRLTDDGQMRYFVDIRDHPPGNRQSKEDRIKSALQPLYANGMVHHRVGCHKGIEGELNSFPAIRPDRLDALYYAYIEAFPAAHEVPNKSWLEEAIGSHRCKFDWFTGKPLITEGSSRCRSQPHR